MPGSKLSDYDILYMIGSGSYGKCLKVRRKSDSKLLVWKDMDYGSMTEPEKQQLVAEVNLLRELKHKYIVRYHDRIIERSKSRLYLIMEYCGGGDLASLITKCRKERKFLDEDFIVKITTQLILALQACHGQRRKSGNQGKVLHRDLKPANVFLDEDKNVKLGDFGLARVLNHDTSFAKTFVGTPYYMSPEQMCKTHYNEKSDIWSLGCLIYELCALVPPFTAANQRLLSVKIKEGKFRRIPTKYSDALQDCIASMLSLTSSERPSLEDTLQCPILRVAAREYGQLCEQKQDKNRGTVDLEARAKVRRNSSNSSSLSSGEVKRSSPDIALLQEREQLHEKVREVEKRERELQRRERQLEERERASEEKMKTAESLIRQYREMRADQKLIRATNQTENYKMDVLSEKGKRQVHFESDSKENATRNNFKYDKFETDFKIGNYRRKLRDLKLNSEDNDRQRFKPTSRFEINNKARVLGLR